MKKLLLITLSLSSMVLLTGCSASGEGDGFFHKFLVGPMTGWIELFANLFDGNYGISIIIMTLIIRFALLPLTVKQYKIQQGMKGKMEAFKPELAEIQAKLKQTTDPEEQKKLQKDMMGLYSKHGVNPFNSGCLPALVQMPILMGFYYAIRGSSEISSHTFLWFNLGQADYILAILAGFIYYVQFKVSMVQVAPEQQQMMKMMGLLSPAMILFISFSAPSALPLYWSVGGLFIIVQTVVLRKLYNPDATPKESELATEK